MARVVPFVLLLSALVLAPFIGGGYGELTNGILQILIFGSVCAYALLAGRDKQAWYRAPGAVALGVLITVSLISLVFSDSLYLSLKQVLFLMACVGGYFVAASAVRNDKAGVMLVCGVALAGLLICVMDIRDYALMTGGRSRFWAALLSEPARRQGGFVNPNFFAAFLVSVLPVSLGLYLVARRRVLTFVFGLAFAVQIASLGMTGSKAGALAATAALMVFLVLGVFSRSFGKQQFVRMLVLAVLIAPIVLVASSGIEKRVEASKTGGAESHSGVHRVYTWKGTLRMIKANPVVGVGPGAFEIAFPRYALAGHTTHAHQSYLQLAAESGVLAFGALIIGLAGIGVAGIRGVFRDTEVTFDAAISDQLSWEDVVPEEGWRLVSCGLVGAFAGSVAANVADSGWYVIGVALPFWILAGVMVGKADRVGRTVRPGRKANTGLLAACAVGMVISASFGLGDMFAPDDMSMGEEVSLQDVMGRYRSAAAVSPINPKYPRELSKMVAANDPDEAMELANRAVRLGPKDAQNYYVRGLVARSAGRMETAVKSFEKAIELKPHSTQIIYDLALTYREMGKTSDYESALRRMLAIEDTNYEKITGVPEMVDTRYARAHVYFGRRYMAEKKYDEALGEYEAAAERLERWRSYKFYIRVARVSGRLSAEEESELLGMLRESYYGLSEAYTAFGNEKKAAEARAKGEEVPDKIIDGDDE